MVLGKQTGLLKPQLRDGDAKAPPQDPPVGAPGARGGLVQIRVTTSSESYLFCSDLSVK